jgi:hypothetical protein
VLTWLKRHPILVGICLVIAVFEALLVLATWSQNGEKAPCRTDGGAAITKKISAADSARLDGTSLDARQTGWRLIPPGRTCELYGSLGGASPTLLARETYPRSLDYISLFVILLLPIPIWWLGRAGIRLVSPQVVAFNEAYRRSKSTSTK